MKVTGLDFVKMAERWKRYSDSYGTEGRKYWMEVDKICLTVATFLLGFIGIFLQIGDISCEPLINRILIGTAFISLLLSMICGVLIFVLMNYFINKASGYYEDLSENLNKWMLKNKSVSADKLPEEVTSKLKFPIWEYDWINISQIFFLAVGLLVVTIYFFKLLNLF